MTRTALKNLRAETNTVARASTDVTRERAGAGARDVDGPVHLRVAHVLHSEVIGGVEMATLRMAEALRESGEVEVLAFCHGGETKVAELFRDSGFKTVGYEAGQFSYFHPRPFLRGVKDVARRLREHEVELVHCSDLMGAYHAGAAARSLRVPVACHIRSNFPNFELRYKPPIMTVNRFAFVSQATWQNFNKIFPVPSRRGTVIYDWAPETEAVEDKEQLRARVRDELGIAVDAPLFGMVARIAPQKDFETLLEAFAQVVAARPRAHLVIVGENRQPEEVKSYYEELLARARELNLTKNITWTGFRRDVPQVLRALDAMVLATHTEGMPLILFEAMTTPVPVVATRVGGVPEIVEDEETGLLHEHGDAQGLARAMLRLIEDPALAVRLGESGLHFVRRRFSRERTIEAVHGLYMNLVGARRAARTNMVRYQEGA